MKIELLKNNTMQDSFLGRGWSFPPEFDKANGKLVMAAGESDIQQSLQILLTTRLGERIMVPDYGCALDEMLFEPLTTTMRTFIKDLVRKAVLRYEPRIELEEVRLDDSGEMEGRLLITVDYRVRATNTRFNFVFPYYKEEGTDL